MVAYTKSATGTNLTATSSPFAWTPTTAPSYPNNSGFADSATWNATSLGGTLTATADLYVSPLTINGATLDIVFSPTNGYRYLQVGSGGITFAQTNSKKFTIRPTNITTGGLLKTRASQTWNLSNTTGNESLRFITAADGASPLDTSNGQVITLVNNSGIANHAYAWIVLEGRCAGSYGQFNLNSNTAIAFTGGNSVAPILEDGDATVRVNSGATGCALYPLAAGTTLNTTLIIGTVQPVIIGKAGLGWTMSTSRDLSLGSSNRILNVAGFTSVGGSLIGTAGLTIQGATKFNVISFASTSGMSGPCNVQGGEIQVSRIDVLNGGLPGWNPTSLTVSLGARFRYYGHTSAYNFPVAPSGQGTVCIESNALATDVTFAATRLTSFQGVVEALFAAASQEANININELPGGLSFVAASTATAPVARIRHVGTSAQSRATSITLDSENNTNLSNLTAGTYELVSNGTGAITLTGLVSRTNSGGGTPVASAPMYLTLNGTNTGANALQSNSIEDGSGFNATLGIKKSGVGRWNLAPSTSNYTGGITITDGTLGLHSNAAAGSSAGGGISQTGGTIEFANGVSIDKSTQTMTLQSVSNSTSLSAVNGNNTIICGAITLNSTIPVDVSSGASLNINNSNGVMSGETFGVTKIGGGELQISSLANTFTGPVTINNGTLTVPSLATLGVVSSLGKGDVTPEIEFNNATGATLKFIGTTVQNTDRALKFSGATNILDASGTGDGRITYTSANLTSGNKTIVLTGTSSTDNTVNFAVSNNTASTTSITKNGTGKWILSNETLSHSGPTTINAGTLNLGEIPRTLSSNIVMSGGTLENSSVNIEPASSITMSGGTISAPLNGSNKTLNVTSGIATLNPSNANGSNLIGGTAEISVGATARLASPASPLLSANHGKALGDMDVIVNGRIETSYASVQRGQIRFAGNVTFGNNSQIGIGAFAA